MPCQKFSDEMRYKKFYHNFSGTSSPSPPKGDEFRNSMAVTGIISRNILLREYLHWAMKYVSGLGGILYSAPGNLCNRVLLNIIFSPEIKNLYPVGRFFSILSTSFWLFYTGFHSKSLSGNWKYFSSNLRKQNSQNVSNFLIAFQGHISNKIFWICWEDNCLSLSWQSSNNSWNTGHI